MPTPRPANVSVRALTKRYGPVEYQVVRLHVNAPVSSLCKLPKNKIPQLTCWVTVQPFEPLPPG